MSMPDFNTLMTQLDSIALEPSQDEIAQLEMVLTKLDTVENSVQRAKRAGMDVGSLETQLLEARTKIQRIIREYKT